MTSGVEEIRTGRLLRRSCLRTGCRIKGSDRDSRSSRPILRRWHRSHRIGLVGIGAHHTGPTIDTARGIEQLQGLAHGFNVVDTDNLDALSSQGEGDAHRTGRPVQVGVSQHFANEPLSGMAYQQWASQPMETVTIS